MTTPLRVDGVDISHWQNNPSLDAFKKAGAAGAQFVIHKATQGLTYKDSDYLDNRKDVKNARLTWGAYHFGEVDKDPKKQAQFFLDFADLKKYDMLPVIDIEESKGRSGKEIADWTLAFVKEVKRITGLTCIVYTPFDMKSVADFGCPLWMARYSNSNTPPVKLPSWDKIDLRQFSNGQYGVPNQIAGLGHVDLNTFGYGVKLSDLRINALGGGSTHAPQPTGGIIKGTKLTVTANKLTVAMAKEVGYREGPNNDNKYAGWAGHANNQPWCATFLEGVSDKIGLKTLIPEGQAMASCDALFTHFQKQNRWSEYPAVGALFFLGQAGSGSRVNGKNVDLYHTGYVYAYDKDNIYTIEGNTNDDGSSNGNGVYARVRPRRGSTVHCYAYPAYPEGIVSADPAWAKAAPVEPPKGGNKKLEKLYIMHASMQFSDTPRQMTEDVDKLFARAVKAKAAWITGTEAGAGADPMRELLEAASKKNGYRFYMAKSQDAWIAVNENLIEGGWQPYFSGKIVDGRAGVSTDKGVLAVSFKNKKLAGDGKVTVIACHYLTRGAIEKTGQYDANEKLAAAIGDYAVKMGKGPGIVFYGGDQNILDSRKDTFFGAPLTSAWDELKKYESTGHGNIDVIASYDPDRRVEALWVRALDDAEFFLHTDHFLVEAGYSVVSLAA